MHVLSVMNSKTPITSNGNCCDDLPAVLLTEIDLLRDSGAKSIGIFAHSNQGVTRLSDVFAKANVDHLIVGLPEAHTEALVCMLDLCGVATNAFFIEEAKTS